VQTEKNKKTTQTEKKNVSSVQSLRFQKPTARYVRVAFRRESAFNDALENGYARLRTLKNYLASEKNSHKSIFKQANFQRNRVIQRSRLSVVEVGFPITI